MHHFSSFNNQWYRKSIEYMQEVAGVHRRSGARAATTPRCFTADCSILRSNRSWTGRKPAAGLGCLMCHSIVQVKSTMARAIFSWSIQSSNELAASENPLVRKCTTRGSLEPGAAPPHFPENRSCAPTLRNLFFVP